MQKTAPAARLDAFRLALSESRLWSPMRFTLRATVTRSGPKLYSLFWELRLTGSGAEEATYLRVADNWNLDTGYPVRMSDLFPPSYPYRKRLVEEAARQLAPNGAGHGKTLRRCRRLFSERSFYLDENNLYFFFPSAGGEAMAVFSAPLPVTEDMTIT